MGRIFRSGVLAALLDFGVFAALAVAPFSHAQDAHAQDARTQDAPGCAAFHRDVADEQAALAAAAPARDVETLPLGAAMRLTLRPSAEMRYDPAPERPPATQSFGGRFAFSGPPGLYRLDLAESAWVDVIEQGQALKPLAFAGAHDCPNLRKSLTFRLSGVETVIQISNAAQAEIALILARELLTR